MPFYNWSQVAADNATADSAVNWQEGQAPSSINDSARAMMASIAKWRDDITGILVAGGTSTAYAISSNQGIVANTDGFTIQFTPAATSTGALTLSVDSQAPKPLRFRTGADLPPGVIISGSLYQATYRAASQEWLLHSFDSSLYAIPIGASVEYWGLAAPNGAFAIPNGQAISRTTYAGLFTVIGTAYGAGDGSTTFNLPNPAGRAVYQRELSASLLTGTYFAGNSTVLGATGGGEGTVLTAPQIPSLSGSASVASANSNFLIAPISGFGLGNFSGGTGGSTLWKAFDSGASVSQIAQISASGSATFTNASPAGVRTVGPGIIANRIMRII